MVPEDGIAWAIEALRMLPRVPKGPLLRRPQGEVVLIRNPERKFRISVAHIGLNGNNPQKPVMF